MNRDKGARMRILQIHDNYKEMGGAEVYFSSLCNTLGKENDVSIFSRDRKRSIRTKNKFVYRDPKNRFVRFAFSHFNPLLFFQLKRWIKEINPDVAHLHINSEYCATVLLALRAEKIPVVQTVHDFGILCPTTWCVKDNKICKGGLGLKCMNPFCKSIGYSGKRSYSFILLCGLRDMFKAWLTKKCVKTFIAPSSALKDKMEENGFGKVTHLPYFTNNLGAATSINGKKKNILYVGRLTRQKGVNYLIEAFSNVLKKIPSARLFIIGNGLEQEPLLNLSKKLMIKNRIKFLGQVPNEKLNEHYRYANVVVVPSVWMENSPLVVYEAMAAERPVIASDIGGIPELVEDRKTGLIFEPGNPANMSEKIIKILQNPRMADRLGKSARKQLEIRLNKETHIRNLMKVYRNLLDAA